MKKYLSLTVILSLAGKCTSNCYNVSQLCEAYENYDEYYIDVNYNEAKEEKTRCAFTSYEYECNEVTPSNFNDDTIAVGSQLKKLKVSQSNLTIIPAGTFSRFFSMTDLNLDFNGIQTLEPGAFNGLNRLQILSLQRNRLQLVEKGVFNSLASLGELDLSYNLVTTIEEGAFIGCKNLSVLNIRNNYLTNITKPVFNSLSQVKFLYLSNNSLLYINTNINVVDLDISSNKIASIDNLNEVIKHLNVSNNYIESLNPASFYNATALVTLDISDNRITELNPSTFNFTRNLKYLVLRSNKLKEIALGTFANLGKLTYLDLSNNSIDFLEYGVFFGLKNLQTLDISNNRLTTLSEYNLYLLEELRVLRFDNNYIQYVDANYICKEFTSSTKLTISMDNNKISCSNLIETMHQLYKCKVVIMPGHSFTLKNIHGIACTVDNTQTANTNKNVTNIIDLTALDEEFKKTDFYHYLHDGFPTVNISVFKEMDRELKSSALFKLLFTNVSNFDNIDRTFSNSSFYKFFAKFNNSNFAKVITGNFNESGVGTYFNKEFFNSKFFEYINKTFPSLMNNTLQHDFASSNFVSFLETDFKNTPFFKFVTEFENSRTAKYTSYVESTHDTLIAILLVVIIIILITAVCKRPLYNIISKQKLVCVKKKDPEEEEQGINLTL